jgi:hypothetical protein
MAKKKNITDQEVAHAVYHTLKDEGLLPPRVPDDITTLEEEFGVYPKAKVNASDALRIAKGETRLPGISVAVPFAELKGKITEELGLAARKGSAIPPDMWAKMKADRKKARDER